ncbi:glycoside hydrolase family 43 protein [Arthrobacter burdickii]|uniref:Family 43 glycosylhydrolase n=1 Tax=Arthrobacter burdickii TaxID=3035920 RepID=A0ABT8JXI3_9MICC|nr:glycoside hydrolase family 43 protein [Arthrobacter burdickii]MDN4609875.1 family 43 glycosylhydrolase [Arthrobacter burdickii]
MPGFHADPTICRVGDDYYLAHSSFEYFPGAPIWHSRDLVNWTRIGHILTRRSQFVRGDGRASTGLYAGTLRHHDGRFWYVTTNVSDYDGGQVLVSATDAAGPWSEPIRIQDAIGIDPDLAWDVDGTCYLTWKGMSFTEGEVGILQAPLDINTGALLEPPYPVWQGSGLAAVEAPHLYQVDDTWYLLLAEGGTERGHAVTIARAPHPRGPFEGHPHNPLLTRRSSIHPVQNAGHMDLTTKADGAWAAVYLGVRVQGSTPGFHVLGRETFLAGIEWSDGWPAVIEDQFEVPTAATSFNDNFVGEELDGRWVVPGGEAQSTASMSPDDGLRIAAAGTRGEGSVGQLCTRITDLRWRAEATIEGSGTFRVLMDPRHWYGLCVKGDAVTATARIGDLQHDVGVASVSPHLVTVRIEAVSPAGPTVPLGHAGPDDIVLSVLNEEGGTIEIARLDGRYLSTEVASGFTGRMLAVGADGTDACIKRVTYHSDEARS